MCRKKAEKAEKGRRVARAMEYGKVQHWHKGPSHAPLRSVNLVLDPKSARAWEQGRNMTKRWNRVNQILHLDMESKWCL